MDIRRIAILLTIAFLGPQASAQQVASKPDRFAPLRFLAGTWRGDQTGQPGRGSAERTYQFVLDDRFLQETNTSTYPPQEKNKTGEVHHHMSMISYDTARKLFVFRQFHTEGFVNTYVRQPTADEKTMLGYHETRPSGSHTWPASSWNMNRPTRVPASTVVRMKSASNRIAK